jgi:hypothetical protein
MFRQATQIQTKSVTQGMYNLETHDRFSMHKRHLINCIIQWDVFKIDHIINTDKKHYKWIVV